MEIGHLLDELVLNGVLDCVLVYKLGVVVGKDLEELLDLIGARLLGFLGFTLLLLPLV